MRLLVFALALVIATPVAAQERAKKKQKQIAHQKPTPEQIRKFKDLEKKQKRS